METIRSMIVYNIDLQCRDSNWDTRKKIVQSQDFFDENILDFSFFANRSTTFINLRAVSQKIGFFKLKRF